jgi:hypothetical protein
VDEDAVSHREIKEGTDQSRHRFVATFADISAAFAIVAILVYILGLIALGVPIYRLYTQDLSVTWHAISLAPRTTVAGLGVQRLFTVPTWVFIYIAVSILGAQLVVALLRLKDKAATMVGWLLSLVLSLLLNGLLVWWMLRSEDSLSKAFSEVYSSGNWVVLIVGLGALIVYAIGAFTVGIELIAQVYFRSRSFLPGLHDPKKALHALAVWFGILFLAGLMQASIAQPPLPDVEVNATNSKPHIKGTLLAHTDGYWYIFVTKTHVLRAIPDSEAEDIQVRAD